jgi:hypothetical protein
MSYNRQPQDFIATLKIFSRTDEDPIKDESLYFCGAIKKSYIIIYAPQIPKNIPEAIKYGICEGAKK